MEATENRQTSYLSVIFVISLVALLFAFGTEYILGFKPCILCLYQRIPYLCTCLLSRFGKIKPQFSKLVFALCCLAFIAGSAIAFYHSGVEHHIFTPTDKCNSVSNREINTIEDMRQQIMANHAPSCSDRSFVFLGLSMTEWNFVLSLALAIYSARAYLRCRYAKK